MDWSRQTNRKVVKRRLDEEEREKIAAQIKTIEKTEL